MDPLGLAVYKCKRPINIGYVPDLVSEYILPYHTWLKTDTKEAGMGGDCPTPGQGCADIPYVTKVKVTDHTGQSEEAGAECQLINGINEDCVNKELELEKNLGIWNLGNQCKSFTLGVEHKCNPDIYKPKDFSSPPLP
jgi:hypothetical protein